MYSTFVFIHVLCGVLSLALGFVAMRARKGGKIHLKAGILYYYGMVYVCTTALIIQFFNFIPFLALISLFSLYFVLMGRWALRYKKPDTLPNKKEKVTIVVFSLTGLIMIAYAIFGSTLSIIILIFGIAAVVQGIADLKNYHKLNKEKKWWLVEHINKIGASYIAAVTAFFVNNSERYAPDVPDILIWIGPGIIGSIIMAKVAKKYESKRNIQNA